MFSFRETEAVDQVVYVDESTRRPHLSISAQTRDPYLSVPNLVVNRRSFPNLSPSPPTTMSAS